MIVRLLDRNVRAKNEMVFYVVSGGVDDDSTYKLGGIAYIRASLAASLDSRIFTPKFQSHDFAIEATVYYWSSVAEIKKLYFGINHTYIQFCG